MIGNGVVYRIFREFARQNDAAGGVGIAPVALVVVLVVGRGDMPALVQRAGVVLIAGEIPALSYRALTIADLDEVYALVIGLRVVTEVGEVAEGRAGVVELGERALNFHQLVVVVDMAGGVVCIIRVVAALIAKCIKSVDVSEAAGPGHLEAVDADKVLVGNGSGSRVTLCPLSAERTHIFSKIDLRILDLCIVGGLISERVRVVGDGEEVEVFDPRSMLKCLSNAARAVGDVGV